MTPPPLWLVTAINAFRNFLIRLNRRMFPGNVVLYEQFQSFWVLPSLYVATKLNIATILQKGPMSVEDLAKITKADANSLFRVLRALASQGIFKEDKKGRFINTATSKGIAEGSGSLRAMILHHLGPVNWDTLSQLEYSVMTGKDAFSKKYGVETYEFLKNHPVEQELFDQSMSNLSDIGLDPILHSYNFSKFRTIVDIGGGEGFLLANILNKCNLSNGILFDTPGALEKSSEIVSKLMVENRLTAKSGDFFERVPENGDLYILKNIVHNWSDEKVISLLQIIQHAMNPAARILIIEMVIPDRNIHSTAKLLDIQMLATMQGGKERTWKEYDRLLQKSGLQLNCIIPTIAPLSLIEASKIG